MSKIQRFPVSAEATETKSAVACDLANLLPDLLPCVKAEICARWKRGVRIRYLASEYRLTVAQAEAVIWEPQRNMAPPSAPARMSLSDSRMIHVVARRAA